ncbi:MAG: DUF4389 domain-containing protein [Deltaproteobacteria bacterium]|nr:DUF4389 domain-containing protein [Deltaproteobacteria bacterium]
MLLFLALPVFAAVQTSALGGGAYVTQEGPRVVKLLRWVVAALAYLLQLTDRPPDEHYAENITLEVKPGGVPTPSSALLRWAQSVPALLILCVISVPAAALWVMSLVLVLWSQKVPPWLHRFQLAVLSYAAMLLAYHGSVVDAYATLDLGTSDHGHHADPQPV